MSTTFEEPRVREALEVPEFAAQGVIAVTGENPLAVGAEAAGY